MPWRYVCDRIWDCPGGTDELRCKQTANKKTCPGRFSCVNSLICVALEDICDGVTDCPNNEDEVFCLPRIPECPTGCKCLLYSISCDLRERRLMSPFSPYIYAQFTHSSDSSHLSYYLSSLNQSSILNLQRNNIINLCDLMPDIAVIWNNAFLYDIDFSHNEIRALFPNCFSNVTSLMYLNISKNRISSVASHALNGTKNLISLDMANNSISSLGKFALFGLFKLQILNVSGNALLEVSSFLLWGSMGVRKISTNNYKICCIKPSSSTECPVKPTWPNSCGRLLDDVGAKVVMWLVSVIGLLLNITSLIYNNAGFATDVGKGYRLSVTGIAFGDLFMCTSLLMTAIADSVFGNRYLEYESIWRKHPLCYSIATISFSSNLISVYTIHMMALSRFFVIRNTQKTKFARKKFLTYALVIGTFMSMLLAVAFIVSYRVMSDAVYIQSGLCILIGYRHKEAIPTQITIVTVITQALSAVTIPGVYLCLYWFITLHRRMMKGVRAGGGKSDGISKSLFASLTNMLCWIPSAILLVMTLTWDNYPHKILIWTTVIVLPLNALINPVIFTHVKWILLLVEKVKSNSQHTISRNPSIMSRSNTLKNSQNTTSLSRNQSIMSKSETLKAC